MKSKQSLLALGTSIVFTATAHAVTDTKAATGTDLAAGASWADTTAPLVADPGIINWTSTSLGTGLTLGSATTWYGMNVQGSADASIGITGAGTLTLGSGGIKIESTGVNTSIGNNIALGSVQSWSAASGKTLTVSGIVSGTAPLIIGAASQTTQTFLTTAAQTLFTGVGLSDLLNTGGMVGGAWVASGNNLLGNPRGLTNDGTTATYWLDVTDAGAKSVQVQLSQSGSDITAKVLAAQYNGGAGTLATSDAGNGYGGHTTTLITKNSAYGGAVSLSGNNTFSGGLIVAGGALTGTTGMTVNDAQGGSFGTGSITVNTGATVTTGAVFMIGGNTTTRVVNLNGGTLNLQAAGAGGEYIRTINMTGGTLNYTSGGVYFRTVSAGLSLNSLAAATSSTITTGIDMTYGNITVNTGDGAATNDLVISGIISQNTGAGSGNKTVTKDGAGTLLLSGANTYAGGTTVSGGTLTGSTGVVYTGTQGGSFGTGPITVNTGAILTSSASFVIGGGQSTTRVLNVTGGTVDLKSTSTGGEYLRTINLTGGTILTSDGGTGGATSDWFRAANGGLSLNSLASATTSTISTRFDLTFGNLVVDVADGAAANDLLISGNITENTDAGAGARSLTKTGAGTLTLTGTNTYSGATTINGGTLGLGATGSIANSTSVTIASGALLEVSAAGFTLGTGKTLTGGRSASPATDISGNLTVNGTLKPAADGVIGTLTTSGNLTLGGVLNIDRNASTNDSDTITLNGTLTIQPGLVVNVNSLGIPNAGIKTYTVISGFTSIVNESNLPAVPGFTWDSTSESGKLKLVQSGSNLTWKGNSSNTWDFTDANWDNGSPNAGYVDGDFVTFDDTAAGSGAVTVNIPSDVTPGSVIVNNTTARDYTIQSVGTVGIAGPTTLVKTGNGLLNLASTNIYTGGSILTDGILAFGTDSLGTTGAITMDGGTLRWATGNTRNVSSRIVMAAGKTAAFDTNGNDVTFTAAIGSSTTAVLVKAGAGTLRLTTVNNYTGDTVVNSGSLTLDGSSVASATPLLASPKITNSATVNFYRNGAGYTPVNASLSGTGDYTIDGPGGGTQYDHRVILRGSASDNTGTIHVINNGKLWVDQAGVNAIGDASVVEVGPSAKFYIYQGVAETIGGLSGSGNVYGGDTAGTSALTVGGGDQSASFSGVLQNNGSTLTLTKIGTGTQTLTGINTYTGATTVNAGTLAGLGAAGSNFTVKNSATLSPGVGVGIGLMNTKSLTCESGATLKLEINSSTATADRIVATGTVSLTGTAAAFTEIGSGSVAPGTKLVILDYTGHSLAGTFTGLAEGASVTVGSSTYKLSYVDASRITLTAPALGFAQWLTDNAPGQSIYDDHDGDGVPNGVEYFMGLSGSAFTANPAPDSNRKVSWTKGTNYAGVYGIDYAVQTSTNLSDWTDVPVGQVSDGSTLEYIIPLDSNARFTRLKVTGP